MKRTILVVLIFVVGLGIIAYPTISNYLSEKNGSFVIDSYEQAVSQQDAEAIAAVRKRAIEYNENLTGSPARDPFIDGTGIVMQADYYEILNIGGTMGFVEIPKINVKLPIYHGTSGEVLKKGIGHLEGSTLPIGGEGHSVITGHTGLPNARLFTDLTALKEGDLFYIHVLDEILAYEVDDIRIIEPDQTRDIKLIPGEDHVTLLTCTPYMVNSHRLIVRGVRTEYIPEVKESIKAEKVESDADRMVKIAAISTSAIMLVLIILTLIIKNKKEKKESLTTPVEVKQEE